jgi:hypothetical protein
LRSIPASVRTPSTPTTTITTVRAFGMTILRVRRAVPTVGAVERREHRNTPHAYFPKVLYFAGRPTVAGKPVFAADCGQPLPFKVGAAICCYCDAGHLSMGYQRGSYFR